MGPCMQIPGGEAMAPRPGPSALAAAAAAAAELHVNERCPPCRKPDHGTPDYCCCWWCWLHRPSTVYRLPSTGGRKRVGPHRSERAFRLAWSTPALQLPLPRAPPRTSAERHSSSASLNEVGGRPGRKTAPAPLDDAACSSSATELPSLFGWQALPQAMTAAGLAGYHCT